MAFLRKIVSSLLPNGTYLRYGKDETTYGRYYFRLTVGDWYSVYGLLAKPKFGESKIIPRWIINSKKVVFSVNKIDENTYRCIILPVMLYFFKISKK